VSPGEKEDRHSAEKRGGEKHPGYTKKRKIHLDLYRQYGKRDKGKVNKANGDVGKWKVAHTKRKFH